MNIYAIEIPKSLTGHQMEKYLSQIPIERQEKVRRYVREEDAIRSLCGSLITKFVLWEELKTFNFSYTYNKYGKPFIREFPSFHYNLSHSHNWVVCATDNNEVGIDIEKIKDIDLGIAERFFTPIEFAEIQRRPHYEQLACFYEYWTMKESFIKALGRGLSIPLNSFSIREENGVYKTIDQNSKLYYFKQPNLDKEYKLAVCSKKKISEIRIQYVNMNDFDKKCQT
ncbi:4'-phosphopantetheinyl transferase family protein [Peribacillus phoenicis]|uniref:4'-phosphopantetheinyl transferase family protein n=1 Tax=unclassified Peribacillus TaxID=2675266 RepID=UPI00399F9ABA